MKNLTAWSLGLVLTCTLSAGCRTGAEIPTAEINERIRSDAAQADLAAARRIAEKMDALLERGTSPLAIQTVRKIDAGLEVAPGLKSLIRNFWSEMVAQWIELDRIKLRWSPGAGPEGLPSYDAHVSMAYYIWTLQYYYAVVIHQTLKPGKNTQDILNDADPELGIPPYSYQTIKYQLFSWDAALTLSQVLAARQLGWMERDYERTICPRDPLCADAYRRFNEYTDELLGYLDWDVAYDLAKTATESSTQTFYFDVWFPVQKVVAERMGDIRVIDPSVYLVQFPRIRELQRALRPGDVLFVRRNWFMSNVGLPGFWPHAALYLGTPEELAAHLDGDEKVQKHFGGAFTTYLRKKFPEKFALWASRSTHEPEGSFPHRVIEAQSEGVEFTSIQHSAHGDYVAALSPNPKRFGALHRALLIERAFELQGRPYDFDFNFNSEATIVCTELVYDAYQRAGGPRFDLIEVMGRPTLPANEMVRQFCAGRSWQARYLDTETQGDLTFVGFLDGSLKTGSATWATEEEFCESWERPKFSALQE